jgi:hypothetical protein
VKLASVEGEPVQLVEEKEHRACITASRTQAGLFGDTLVEMHSYLEAWSTAGRGARIDECIPCLLNCVARDKVRPVGRKEEPRRLGERRVDNEAITQRDRKKQRFESMQRGPLLLRQHAQPGIEFGPCLNCQAHRVFSMANVPSALII